MNDRDKLKALKDLLFEEDRQHRDSLDRKIVQLNEEIEKERQKLTIKIIELDREVHDKDQLKRQVDPMIDEKIDRFVDDIPQRLGPSITETLKIQIRDSRDEVVEALYPIMGRMIKKYIQKEIRVLSERIDRKFEQAFSFEGWWRRIKSWFTGVKETDLMIGELADPRIEEIFLVEKHSGILLGSYSRQKTLDQDMISGMLTAIKSFVEDAFQAGNQSLELIEYDLYKIHIQNFHRLYVAVVLSGALTSQFRSDLEDKILEFVEKIVGGKTPDSSQLFVENQFSLELKAYFDA